MTELNPTQHAVQHSAVRGDVRPLHLSARPTPGPIAVLPAGESVPFFSAAIEDAGAVVASLDAETRGLVWLSSRRGEELDQVLRTHPQIGWVQLPWAGVDAVTDVIAAHPGVLWTSAKGSFAEPVAEHALTLLLALLRVLPKRVRATSWSFESEGRSLYGRHVVVIGAGGIAREIIRLLAVFRVRVTVVRRSEAPVPGASATVTSDKLDEVLPHADAVIVAAASTHSTRHLLGSAQFALMRPDAILVNIARGALVDDQALLEALRSGRLGGAGLDVTDPEPLPDGHPLWDAPNCIITPHTADTPAMTAPLLAERIRTNARALLGGGEAEFEGIVDPLTGY